MNRKTVKGDWHEIYSNPPMGPPQINRYKHSSIIPLPELIFGASGVEQPNMLNVNFGADISILGKSKWNFQIIYTTCAPPPVNHNRMSLTP